jgi:DNA polymerase-1
VQTYPANPLISNGRVIENTPNPRRRASGRLSFQQCCNFPVQGICADAMLRAIALVHRRFTEAGIRGGLVASVHDELLCETHEDDAERARALLEQAMLDAFVMTFPGAPTANVATAHIGRTWAEAKGDGP